MTLHDELTMERNRSYLLGLDERQQRNEIINIVSRLRHCSVCGVAVSNVDAHDNFHQMIAGIVDAIASLTGQGVGPESESTPNHEVHSCGHTTKEHEGMRDEIANGFSDLLRDIFPGAKVEVVKGFNFGTDTDQPNGHDTAPSGETDSGDCNRGESEEVRGSEDVPVHKSE